VVDGPAALDGAPDLPTLLRTHAEHIAGNTRAAPHELGAVRRRYREVRSALPRMDAANPADLSTTDGWFRAFVAGSTHRADLDAALCTLEAGAEPQAAHLRSLLAAYPTWIRARFDPHASRNLLRRVVRAMRPGGDQGPLEPDAALRRAALRARREHPGLESLAPELFGELLTPDYRAGAPVAGRRTRSRVGARRPTRQRTSSAISGWTFMLIVMTVSGAVRGCARLFERDPKPSSSLRRALDDLDAIERRRRERLERFRLPREGPASPGSKGETKGGGR